MEFLKRSNYFFRFTLVFLLSSIFLVIMGIGVFYFEQKSLKDELNRVNTLRSLENKKELFLEGIHNYENIIKSLTNNDTIEHYIKQKNSFHYTHALSLIYTLTKTDPNIMQLRYIDSNGDEKIRIDRQSPNSSAYILTNDQLQNKFHRDYFQKTIQLRNGEFYISKLDLNIEHNQIETPFKPVLRFATPLYYDEKLEGIFIVNVFMEDLLKKITTSDYFDFYLYDQNNCSIYSSDPTTPLWQSDLKQVCDIDPTSFENKIFLYDNAPVQALYFGVKIKKSPFNEKQFLHTFYKLLFIIIPFSIFLAYLLARIPKRLFDELEEQQQLMIQQSKLAAVGEMLGAIAHQWRQPLNAVGVLAQEMQLKFQYDQLTKQESATLTEELQNYLEYMSKTIDDFRDFFKPTKEKTLFNLVDAIKDALKITSQQLKHHNIVLELKTFYDHDNFATPEEVFLINSYEGEFKQVIINLINNAREAIEDRAAKIALDEKRIWVKIQRDEDEIVITLTDNGGGIQQKNPNKIFDAYHSTKEQQQGTGLGLYISKMIIERNMLGELSVKNVPNGAEFSIRFFVS